MALVLPLHCLLFYLFLFFLKIYLFILEIESVSWGWGERGVEGEEQADSTLSAEPDAGLDPRTLRS